MFAVIYVPQFSLQAVLRQFRFLQSQKREMRQIAQHCLEPAVLGQDGANANIQKLIDIEREHCNVLRCSGRRDRIKNRL